MFVLSGYTAALIGFPSVLAPGTVFDTAVSRVEEITLGVVCVAIVHSLIFPKSAFSAFEQKLRSAIADTRRWLADGLTQQATPDPKFAQPPRRSGPNRCTRTPASRCCRHWRPPSLWASVLSFGSPRPGRKAPAPLPLPPWPALYLLLWTIRRRPFATFPLG